VSFAFDVDGETVWSPALLVGELYVRTTEGIAGAMGMSTGLDALASDMYDIDLDVFEAMVNSVYAEYFSAVHPLVREMLRGMLLPSIVILERSGRPITARSDDELSFLKYAHSLPLPR
jgi:hypothetical protein